MGLPIVSMVGNVKRPELKYSASGKAVHRFQLECSEKDKNGNWENLYIKVTTFGDTAEFVNRFFHEGSVAVVSGKLKTEVWESQDGKKNYEITFKFPSVDFAPKDKTAPQAPQSYQKPQSSGQAYNQTQQQQNASYGNQGAIPEFDVDSSEIPF